MVFLFFMTDATFWNPEIYGANARFVADLGEPLLLLLEPKVGDLILDLGCGDGALTKKIAASGAKVIGVDSSYEQMRASKQHGLRGLVMDGQALCFKACFDAVFTNAALHWMKQPLHAAIGVRNALRSGGRFIGEFGGKANVEVIRKALHEGLRRRDIDPWSVDPWYFPSTDEYAQLLAQVGFTVDYIELVPRPTKLPGDILGWLEVFAQPFTNAIPPAARPAFLDEVRHQLKPTLLDADGRWEADYVRLRFKAHK